MATFTGGQPNIALATSTQSFASLGFTNANIEIVFEVGASLKSWKPDRSINAITGTVIGNGYYIVAKTDINLPNDFATSIEEVVLMGDGDFISFP